ncbi:MAG TPA: hypothetical protein VMS86_05260 [Thermoanaerobaculia bacterium]|nr:hypothetical protein [Thermoanaerobaculia bacterium]
MTLGSRSTAVTVLALLLAAALTRFVGLGHSPLDAGEASQSIAAWWTVTGADEGLARLLPQPESALLFSLDFLLFWLGTGASDGLARLVPAAVGAALVLLPIGLRSAGWPAVVPLALLLAVDPWLVAQSRRSSGAILAVGAAVACHLLLRRLAGTSPGSATAEASRRQWVAWSIAVGLLVVSGPAAWDFLPPVLAGAVLLTTGSRAGAAAGGRPRGLVLLGLAAATALAGATTGLLQWRGPALVSVALESWLASFTAGATQAAASASAPVYDRFTLAYVLALAGLAAWGLVRAWRAGAGADRGWARSTATRVEAETLALWLLWGAALQLRPGRAAETWLALQVPLLLAAALGLEDLAERAARGRSRAAQRVGVAAALTLAVAFGLGGVHRVARDDARDGLPPVRRLAEDVAALEERPESERPRIDVVSGERIDPLLAWYLRRSRVRWIAGDPTSAEAAEPQIVLLTRTLAREEMLALPPGRRYAIAASGDRVDVVEMR